MQAMEPVLHTWADRIRDAAARQTPLRIRGGGSKDFYGQTLQGELLDTREYRGVVSYEPSELVVTVRAGTPLPELEATLAERGQCLAFEPPHFALNGGSADSATCGGLGAAGLSGPARANVGGVRDFVLGATLLNGRAELLQFGGQVMKNVAGYDVSRLLVGTWGTLGVLTEVSLKVLPVVPAEATLVFELDQAQALAQLHRWGGQPLPLNASCWVQDRTEAAARELLFVRLRGAVAAVAAACSKMGGERLESAVADPDWQACRDLRLPFFSAPAPELGLWRLSVAQTAPLLNLPWAQLVEWHGAQRWLWAPAAAAHALREAAALAGGHATLFVAPRTGPESWPRFTPLAEPLARIQRQLKAEFDPAGIFNPGRI
jgi:glycolate oxidase FAD binding subunit